MLVSKTYIRRYLKKNKMLKFKRVNKVPQHAKSLRNLHMRR